MRKLSRVMMGWVLGATVVAPIAAQAQENGRGRGGDGGWQRGGGDGGGQRGGGWQRGADQGAGQRGGDQGGWRGGERGAVVNGDARREAIQQAREAQRQVERPAPVEQPQTSSNERRPQWRGDRGDGNRAGDDSRPREIQKRVERRDMVETNRERRQWNGGGDHDRRDGDRDRGENRRDGNRDDNRHWNGDGRDWKRDGHRNWSGERRDGNHSWSSDRRDWDRNDNHRWNRDWRGDRRYGWQDYRTRHRNIYRLPRYEARHGYSYRRWYPGYRWDSWFYSSSFWISDPWQYRLPPAYAPYRWVRYYDDVALVDTETGEIVDIIYNFFW